MKKLYKNKNKTVNKNKNLYWDVNWNSYILKTLIS